MNQQKFAYLKSIFCGYVDSFRDEKGSLHPMLQLKYDHSLRVADEAREIASDLGWGSEDIRLAETVGLFHDVGRFSQFQEFKTYYDPKSVNHGCRGFEVLQKSDWLTGLSDAEKCTILEAVRLHNCHLLPENLSPQLERHVNLVRDADKLDIFFVLNNAIEERRLNDNPGIIWNLPRNMPPSRVILDDLCNHRQARYENVKSEADFCLLQLCWIYDLNYLPTIRRVAEREIVTRIASTLPVHDDINAALQHLHDFLHKSVSGQQ